MANQVWSSVIQIVISTVLIWQQLGLATIAGIGVMVLMMVPNGLISNRFKTEQSVQMTNKDGRTKTLNEALSGIKVLKVYAWTGKKREKHSMNEIHSVLKLNDSNSLKCSIAPTDAFIKRITSFRNKEVVSLRTIMICFSIIVFCFNSATFWVCFDSKLLSKFSVISLSIAFC